LNNYGFSLTPHTSFVKGLCDIYSNDFSIIDESDSSLGQTDVHIFCSIHLNLIVDLNELRTKLKGLLMIINGTIAVTQGFERHKNIGFVTIDGCDGVSYSEMEKIHSMDVTQVNPFNISNLQEMHKKADVISKLINLSSKNENLRIILGMCAIGSDWVNLYRILETVAQCIQDDYNQGKIQIHGNIKKKLKKIELMTKVLNIDSAQVKLFTRTVNSFEMLGYLSRHGKGSVSNDNANPMSRLDASNLVNQACRHYCGNLLSRTY